MRIAVFTDSFWPQINGVTVSIWNTCTILADQGHEFLIIAPRDKTGYQNIPEHNNIQIELLPASPLPTYTDYLIAYHFPERVKKTVENFHPEIIHIHTPFYTAKKGIMFAKKLRIPVVGTFHTLLSEFLDYLPIKQIKENPIAQMMTWKYTQHFYSKCDVITTPTNILAEELGEHGFKNVKTLSNGIDYDLFSKAKISQKTGRKNKLVYFGRISFEKRLDVAVYALKIVLEKHPNTELFFVGNGPAEKELKKQAKELGVEKKVIFTGILKGEGLAKEIKSKDILVAPSPMETQGMYVLEGMAAGLAVVGANKRAIPVAIGKNKRGLLFEPGNAKDCAKQINVFIENPQKRKKIAKEARKFAKKFDRKITAKEFLSLYKKAIQENQH
jgi:glycosyltransferase involved in cell wall biosynthesis